MRLLVFGHVSHTGFGTVTENLCARFLAAGLDVRVIGVNHRGEPVRGPLAGRVWPAGLYGDGFAGDWSGHAISGQAWQTLDPEDEWKPDAVLVVSDVSGLLGHIGKFGSAEAMAATWLTVPVFHYVPIEGTNLPPAWRGVWKTFQPVAMSDYGARIISEHIGRDVPRIYHGVDTETFHPVSPGNPLRFEDAILRTKEDCKRVFKMDPARKLILRTDRNVIRKNYDVLLRAFVDIARGDPEVDLLVHCVPLDREGFNILEELMRLPEDIRDRIHGTQMHDTFKGLPTEGLVALYNAADIYMTTTGGEGFGLTLAEAMSCGIPVVSTGWAAEVEVIGDGGITVPPLHDAYGEPVTAHSSYGMDWAVPDPKAFTEPVLRLLSHKHHRQSLGQAGRLHVKRSFSWDVAAAQFLDLFTDVSQEAAA